MSHYFETPSGDANYHGVQATIWGRDYSFVSAAGVFSANRLDPGTSVLLRSLDAPADAPGNLLDLGCGFGPIAVALGVECPQAQITAIDVNDRALDLTNRNAQTWGVASRVRALRPEQVDATVRFDEIWSNPPIRIGKAALHELLGTWLARLTPDGVAHLVVSKNLGADSLQHWLTEQGWDAAKIASAKGFRVLNVHRRRATLAATTPFGTCSQATPTP